MLLTCFRVCIRSASSTKALRPSNVRTLSLEVGQDIRVDAALQPGDQTQTVTVTEAVPLVETTNAELGGTLSNQIINDLPLNGRNFKNLLQLRPGVMIYPGGSGGRRAPMAFARTITFTWWTGSTTASRSTAQSVMNESSPRAMPVPSCRSTPSRNSRPSKILGRNTVGSLALLSMSGSSRAPIRFTGPPTLMAARTPGTPGTTSTEPLSRNRHLAWSSTAAPSAAPSRRTSCFTSSITKLSNTRWARCPRFKARSRRPALDPRHRI